MPNQPKSLIAQLVAQQREATPVELNQMVAQAASAPFALDLLEVDEPLWGSFWQFDVIAPGYTLPAVELNLLRAIRLDATWPEETGVAQFLADLHAAVQHPQAGVWTLPLAGEPCVMFAAPGQNPNLMTVVWFCATTGNLHAGYRTGFLGTHFSGAVGQRPPRFAGQTGDVAGTPPEWLALAVEHLDNSQPGSLAARLDAEILRWRLGI